MIKLITHNDLDGVGCYVVMKALLDNAVDISYCTYRDVNETVLEVINSEENYEKIFITDISVTEEVAKELDNISEKVVLLDHHPTALFLNEYSWATVKEYDGEEKTCGTKMLYDYLLEHNKDLTYNWVLDSFVTKVRLYDTWLWAEKYYDISAKQLNDLRYILGKDDFVESMLYKILYKSNLISDFDAKILAIRQREIDSYIEKKDKDLIVTEIKGYKAGVVIAESHQSELGNRLSELHPELDLIAMISQNGISYRTVKDDVNVSEIAKYFGGGGHPKASGSSVPKVCLEGFILSLFNR